MTISWFLTARHPQAVLDDAAIARIDAAVRAVPAVVAALRYTPGQARDPYLDDGRTPILVLQLDFAEIEALEAALAPEGAMHDVVGTIAAAAEGAAMDEQALIAREFPVPAANEAARCTYLVAYFGAAEDLNAWLRYYIAHHPPIMARFPGIRGIAIYTRIDWCSALPIARADAFQRNKVVFDDEAALDAALNSPVRHEMRADFKNFPPFRGANTHYAMVTERVVSA